MGKLTGLFAIFALAAGAPARAAEVSPVQKVVELLANLKGKCEADLAQEEKEMDAYLEYCDDEASTKKYAIKTANREIADLEATIADGAATMSRLEEEIEQLGSTIASKESELADAKALRAEEKAEFTEKEKGILETVDEMQRAEVTLRKEMSFLQVKSSGPSKAQLGAVSFSFQKILEAESAWADDGNKRRLKAFLQGTSAEQTDELSIASFRAAQKARQPQATVAEYTSHSGGIVDTVTDMKEKAEASLSDARKKEMKAAHVHKMLEMNLNDEISLLNKKLADATAGKAAGEEASGKAKGELASVEKSKAADEEYVATLTAECSEKSSMWAERKESAAGEMAAIDKAKEILESGVKALVQTSVALRRLTNLDSILGGEDDKVRRSAKKRILLAKQLQGLAKTYKSFALMQLASAAKQDPFGKIKSLIEDMITKLLDEANEEADHKAFCDEEQAKSTKTKEDKMMAMDKYQGRMDSASTSKAELEEAIKALEGEVAKVDKLQAEATKLREEEKATYLQAKSDYSASAEAVEKAMGVLKSYYEGSLIQTGSVQARRSALEIAAKAKQPTFGTANTDAGGSIISILEVALSDFTALLAETETTEQEAEKAYQKLTDENAVSKAAKEAEVAGKTSEIKSLSSNLMHYREDHSTVSKELEAVMDYMDKLKPQCTAKVMSYEERVARREAEMEGLKEALAILEGESI